MTRRTTGLTRRDVDALYAPLRDAHEFLSKGRDVERPSRSSLLSTGVEAAEVGGGALLLGYLYGRTQKQTIGTTAIPIGLALGVAGHLAALFGPKVLRNNHVRNVSNGAIASWTTMVGAGYGQDARQKAGQPTAPIAAGVSIGACGPGGCRPPAQLGAGSYYGARPAPLTEPELAAYSRAVR